MRSPLPALQAFSLDAQATQAADGDDSTSLSLWLRIAKAAERVSSMSGAKRLAYVGEIEATLLPPTAARPSLIHDALPAPSDPVARFAERLRVEADEMERGSCFQLAFTTVSAVCRLTAESDLVTRMLAIVHLGRIARQLDDQPTASDCYMTVVNEASRERDGPLEALGHLGLGAQARMRGNRPEERRHGERALMLAYPNGRTERSAHLGMMNIAMAERRVADSLLHGWRAYDLGEEGSEFRAMILGNLALVAHNAGFHQPALQGFLHALTLTPVLRLRILSYGGAVRAAAALKDRALMESLDREGFAEARRANIPFEMGLYFAAAAEAWCSLPDRAVAEQWLTHLEAILRDRKFHELAARAEACRTRLDNLHRSPVAAPSGAWSTTVSDEANNHVVLTGIDRLLGLPV